MKIFWKKTIVFIKFFIRFFFLILTKSQCFHGKETWLVQKKKLFPWEKKKKQTNFFDEADDHIVLLSIFEQLYVYTEYQPTRKCPYF